MNETQAPQVSSAKLVATLGLAGAFAGLLLVLVFQWTEPAILAHRAEMLKLAVSEVLQQPDHTAAFYVHDDALLTERPEGVDGDEVEVIYAGYDAEGTLRGLAITAGEPGFQDIVKLIFGFDPKNQRLLGMKVLESKETPGLGDKIEKDLGFVEQFNGVTTPIVGVKSGPKATDSEVDMITGATISSRAVIRIINNAIARLEPVLKAPIPDHPVSPEPAQ